MIIEKLRVCELFAGVGGFRIGIEQALGKDSVEIVYANDFDKYCAMVYNKNFGGKIDGRSITDVLAEEIPDHDLLVGGFPCPAFSIAGKRLGFEDLRGQLIFDIIRILRVKQPKFFLLENVAGLLSHNQGKTMEIICEELCESGYALDFELLNSKDFGVAQNRLRLFIIGKRLDTLQSDEIL